nr:thylakoid lumenal 29 kda protein, chloroplastic [Quercus suber]
MGVSFLSTLSPLLPPVPVPSLTTPTTNRYPSYAVTVRCNKMEIDATAEDEDRICRRDILKCAGVTIGMGNVELIPSLLTLALNDAMTYDKATKSGGANGSIRFSSELSRPENKGISAALNLLDEAKKEIDSYSKGGPISYADLIQYAAQGVLKSTFLAAAIRKCGGNEEKGRLVYTAYGSNGQWGLFDKQFGRADTQEPDPEGRVPLWENANVKEMKDKFVAIGFGPRQLAVMSAFLGPDQVATEALLATDPDVSPWVQKYQRSRETVSETDYEVDLITTLTKLSSLGQQINYEAYTYPVQRVDLSKLKL